jgi:hypothetical protein
MSAVASGEDVRQHFIGYKQATVPCAALVRKLNVRQYFIGYKQATVPCASCL